MNTISQFDISNIYEQTTLILGTESLIMGITLLTLRSALKNSGSRSKSGVTILAIVMFVLSIMNLLEYMIGVDIKNERYSLALVIFVASMELFLFFTAYMSILSKALFISKRRIYIELASITLFTTPMMFVSAIDHPMVFNILFAIGIVFYCVKFAYYYLEYRATMKIAKEKIENYFSDDSRLWLKWITNTSYVVVVLGVISVVIPMTNLTVLALFNTFLFFAFFYIYISVIQNISIFDKNMLILESNGVESKEAESDEKGCLGEHASIPDIYLRPVVDFMSSRQTLLDDWIAIRSYAVAGVTATEVAARLKTNRTRLSYYFKNELNTTYYEWIARLRIEDAKRQLIEYPDRAVYEIAINVGIEDRDNFRRVFQRYAGVSPTTYRKEHIEDNLLELNPDHSKRSKR